MTRPSWLTPRLLYGAFTVAAFAFCMRWTFPSEAVRERLIYEAGARGWQVDVQDVRPGGLLGVRMDGVMLTDAAGLTIPIERLEASIRPLPLLIGRRVLAYDAAIFEGTVGGNADLNGASRHVVVELKDLDLKRVLPLRRTSGVDFVGLVSGRIDLTAPGGALEKASGTVELDVDKAGIAGGNATIPPFSSPLAVPPLSFGTFTVRGKADAGRITFDRLDFRGGDAELTGDGVVVVLQQRMEYAPVVGKMRVRLSPSLWQKPGTASFRPMVEAAFMNARTPNGSYEYQLFGSLSAPQLRPSTAGGPSTALPPPPPPPPPTIPND